MQKKNGLTLSILVLIFPVLAMACSLFVPRSTPTPAPQPAKVIESVATPLVVPAVQEPPIIVDSETDQIYINLYERVNPSVVNILIYAREGNLFTPVGEGSGFVYDGAGHIITNAHVVHGSEQIDVIFSEGTIQPADIVGEDLHSDLAVIKVEALPQGVSPLPLGDMNSVKVGQSVVAIGNPFGLGGTLTRGIVSALGRTIPAQTSFRIPQSIQTDAAINPGNSGGPLLNLDGQVIGINAQIQTQSLDRSNSGVGFAIPVSIVERVVPGLIQDGEYVWPWMGVSGHALDPLTAQAMALPFTKAAYLSSIYSNGPADDAGLRGTTEETTINDRLVEIGGDIITAVDGQPIESFDDLLLYIALSGSPGKTITMTIYRDGEYKEVELVLEARPASIQQ